MSLKRMTIIDVIRYHRCHLMPIIIRWLSIYRSWLCIEKTWIMVLERHGETAIAQDSRHICSDGTNKMDREFPLIFNDNDLADWFCILIYSIGILMTWQISEFGWILTASQPGSWICLIFFIWELWNIMQYKDTWPSSFIKHGRLENTLCRSI